MWAKLVTPQRRSRLARHTIGPALLIVGAWIALGLALDSLSLSQWLVVR